MRAVALALVPLLAEAAPAPDYAAPYRILQQANLTLDPALAASAYAPNATLAFDYPGLPPQAFRGQDAIRSSYVQTFRQVDAGTSIKLQFRFERPGLGAEQQSGVYRIDATAGDRAITAFGRFSVKLVKQKAGWRFAEDRGTAATAADFDDLPPSKELP